MKRLIPIALVLATAVTACKTHCAEDTGVRVSHVNTVDRFDELELKGPVKLVMKQDESYAITVEADSSVAEKVKYSVSRGTLKISFDPETYCGTDSIVVHAGIGNLKSIKLEGAGILGSEGPINLTDLDIDVRGSGKVDVAMNVAALETDVEGTASMRLVGQAGSHTVKSKGVLNLDAFDFVVGEYKLNIEGTGKSNINALNKLDVESSGASEVFYKGRPKQINKKKTGNARLEHVD